MKSSALDRIFHAGSDGNSFKARNVQNNNDKVGPDKKIGPEKMKILTPCFDPLERRGIVDLLWLATGDGVRL